jgi:hypothetical protein
MISIHFRNYIFVSLFACICCPQAFCYENSETLALERITIVDVDEVAVQGFASEMKQALSRSEIDSAPVSVPACDYQWYFLLSSVGR